MQDLDTRNWGLYPVSQCDLATKAFWLRIKKDRSLVAIKKASSSYLFIYLFWGGPAIRN